jgi:hypothetical protein
LLDACGCSSPKTIEDLRYPSIVFDGEVLSIKKISRSSGFVSEGTELIGDFSSQEITFKLLKQHQGPKMSRITVSFNEQGSTSCDLQPLSFKVGETYQISTLLPPPAKKGSKQKPITSQYFNNFCNLRKHLTTQSR